MKQFWINPVLNKEFKLRFRSFRTFIGLLAYLVAIGIVVIGYILLNRVVTGGSSYVRPEESRLMFMVLAYIQLGLILFITPGLTAGVVSGEREKQTLNILLTTIQSSTSIIFSKLFSSIVYLVLMIVASLPFYSIVFLYGGVSPTTLFKIFGFYLFTIFVFGCIGIFFSTFIRRTIVAMVSSYGICLFLAGGTAFLFLILISYTYSQNSTLLFPYILAMFNPVMAFSAIFQPEINEIIASQTGVPFPIIWSYFIVYSLLALMMLFLSIKKLRPNMKRKKG
ncbi:ABC transporter permease [Lederbergia sp. NSJ-179]|uniref:ABC transporter permease n=1 Tax=Lederbergia sp. NSJ-179 TaxID=2931402 RepID=UPI001FD28A01|nr:ABC transporter permease [Lederbergia sp. NSJ-179]MCJ7841704.1 ABC transporter permease [Lederbergia sp. NSJ-179]